MEVLYIHYMVLYIGINVNMPLPPTVTRIGDSDMHTQYTDMHFPSSDKDWWLARYPGHTHAGYIPASYVARTSSLKSLEYVVNPQFVIQVFANARAYSNVEVGSGVL